MLILFSVSSSLGQYLQESRPGEGEERNNIRCGQKGGWQESETAPWSQGSLQGGGQSHEERHAGSAEERATCERRQRERQTGKGWQRAKRKINTKLSNLSG